MGEFFNPYNFIPTPPRSGDFPKELADAAPVGRHRLHDDRWNGTISVRMTAVSPLLVPSGRVDVDSGHKTKETRVIDGRVVIPPSSVKGMIRSAFEAVTNSRFGEFAKRNREPLAFRQIAPNGLEAFPAVLLEGGKVRILLGESSRPDPVEDGKFAKLKGIAAPSVRISKLDGAEVPLGHGELVEYEVSEGRVTEIVKWDPKVKKLHKFGRVYRTGLTENNRSGRFAKQSERVFCVDWPNDNDFEISFPESLKVRWKQLISDARQQHSEKPEDFADYVRSSSSDSTWSELQEGDPYFGSLMYVRLRWSSADNNWVVDEAQPVAISRQLHPDSPEALLHPSLRPPKALDEFSPAEHVFGWVHPEGKDARSSAYAGSVRFGSVECLSPDAVERFDQPNTLPILDRPKPEQSRFYLGEVKNGTVVPFEKGASKQNIRYAAGKNRALRGRKVYPSQNRQPKRAAQARGKQNQSYRDQVKSGAEFRFDLNVRNLSSTELGALVTVLDLDAVLSDGSTRCLGFGGAKPLGYGSVSLAIDWSETTLHSGVETVAAFRELRSPRADNDEAQRTARSFVDLVSGRPFFESFKIATKGYQAEVPVHYPRVEPTTGDSNKDTLEWFMVNEGDRDNLKSLPPLASTREGKMSTYPPRQRGGSGRPRR